MNLPEEFTGRGEYINVKAGVYAVVNPDGEIYIGQSKDLPERIRVHKKKAGGHSGNLRYSMLKHGRSNHRYYLVEELNENSALPMFWEREKFHIKRLASLGFTLINCNTGGSGGQTKGKHYSKGNSILHPMQNKRWQSII